MRRVLTTTLVLWLFLTIWQSFTIHLPLWLNLFFSPPLILVFSLQLFRPLETVGLCLLGGFLADIFGGAVLGSNMLLMLLFSLGLRFFNVLSSRANKREQIYYVIGVSFIYRIVYFLAQLLFLGSKANIFIVHIFLGPLIDGLLSILLFRLVFASLLLVKAIDQSDVSRNRIGLR